MRKGSGKEDEKGRDCEKRKRECYRVSKKERDWKRKEIEKTLKLKLNLNMALRIDE